MANCFVFSRSPAIRAFFNGPRQSQNCVRLFSLRIWLSVRVQSGQCIFRLENKSREPKISIFSAYFVWKIVRSHIAFENRWDVNIQLWTINSSRKPIHVHYILEENRQVNWDHKSSAHWMNRKNDEQTNWKQRRKKIIDFCEKNNSQNEKKAIKTVSCAFVFEIGDAQSVPMDYPKLNFLVSSSATSNRTNSLRSLLFSRCLSLRSVALAARSKTLNF